MLSLVNTDVYVYVRLIIVPALMPDSKHYLYLLKILTFGRMKNRTGIDRNCNNFVQKFSGIFLRSYFYAQYQNRKFFMNVCLPILYIEVKLILIYFTVVDVNWCFGSIRCNFCIHLSCVYKWNMFIIIFAFINNFKVTGQNTWNNIKNMLIFTKIPKNNLQLSMIKLNIEVPLIWNSKFK